MIVEEEKQIESNMEDLQINSSKETKDKDHLHKQVIELYENAEIGKFVSKTKKSVIKDVIHRAILYTESNNIYAFLDLKNEILYLNKAKNLTIEEMTTLVLCADKLISVYYRDFNLISDLLSLLSKFLSKKNLKIKLDWKIYYKILFQFLNSHIYEFSYTKSLGSDFTKLLTFFPLALKYYSMSEEDYKFLQKEVWNIFLTGEEIEKGLKIIYYFFPKSFFNK